MGAGWYMRGVYIPVKRHKQSGAHFGVIISFKTNTAFVKKIKKIENSIIDIFSPVVSCRPGPIAVWDVQFWRYNK